VHIFVVGEDPGLLFLRRDHTSEAVRQRRHRSRRPQVFVPARLKLPAQVHEGAHFLAKIGDAPRHIIMVLAALLLEGLFLFRAAGFGDFELARDLLAMLGEGLIHGLDACRQRRQPSEFARQVLQLASVLADEVFGCL
jgi:hypothetical protein